MPDNAVHAPWSTTTIAALNQQQHAVHHTYTCPLPNHEVRNAPKLVATRGGWICSEAPDCDYTQDWAHLGDVRFLEELRESLDTPVEDEAAPVQRLVPEEISLDDLARLAYTTYTVAAGGKAVNGDPLPTWDDVSMHVRTCWMASTRAVRQKLEAEPRMVVVPVPLPGD